MTRRVYVVGTDTDVGKTALLCALLRRAATVAGTRLAPFKPAQSGGVGPLSDAARLLDAAGLPDTLLSDMCPLRYEPPLAPGIADDPTPFFRPRAANTGPSQAVLERVATAATAWEASQKPDVLLLEGAGGLQVPMPGGTWQGAWIQRLADAAIIVGRAHLGTINHSLLTIDAVRALPVPVLGFYLVATTDRDDPSSQDNAAVIAAASGIPHLGTLPFLLDKDAMGPFDLLSPLLGAVAE